MTLPPDILGPLIGGAVGTLLAGLFGWLRALQETRRYEIAARAETRRLELIAAAKDDDIRAELQAARPSNPPPVAPLALLLLVTLGAGVGGGLAGHRAAVTLQVAADTRRCTPESCRGGKCVSGKCEKVGEVETAERVPHSDVSPHLLDPRDPEDLSAGEPPS